MLVHKHSIVLIVIVGFINIINIPSVLAMKKETKAPQPATSTTTTQPPAQLSPAQQAEVELIKRVARGEFEAMLEGFAETFKDIQAHASSGISRTNHALGLAWSSNKTAIEAYESAMNSSKLAKQTADGLEKARALLTTLEHQVPEATEYLKREYNKLSDALDGKVKMAEERMSEIAKREKALELEDKIKIAQEKAQETERAKETLGINDRQANIKARGRIEAEKERLKHVREILSDTGLMIKIAVVIIAIAFFIYAIKYGTPTLINYFAMPRVISETSKSGLFGWLRPHKEVDLDNLIFTPSLQKQLSDLTLRVQTAKEYNESLPNVLFYGAPGTGKTAFAKALAHTSGLDYALTSGSEFAKIKNLNNANNELRKLLNWAKRSSKGLIIFIDEAESLFADRGLATTPKNTQDFINTFLSLVSDQSQKKLMFIFATNRPSLLDNAIKSRIGTNIKFTLPESPERTQILAEYLLKFAQDNEEAPVELHPEISQILPKYGEELNGFSPRAIKFVAETMISKARRQKSGEITTDITQAVIDEARHSLQQTKQWKEGCNE